MRSLNRFAPIWMAKLSSSIVAFLARVVKAAMVAVLIPVVIGLLQGILGQLDVLSDSGGTLPGWSAKPPTSTLPALNDCSATMARSMVVLPAPESPMSAQISPRPTVSVTPRST